MLDKEKLERLSYLARLEFKDEEKDKLQTDLERVLDLFDDMQSVDTTGVPITYTPIAIENVVRPDEVGTSLSREEALKMSPDHEAGCFKVPEVLQ